MWTPRVSRFRCRRASSSKKGLRLFLPCAVLLGFALLPNFVVAFSTTSRGAIHRTDTPSPNYLIGYLGINDGVGKITWDATRTFPDPGPAFDPPATTDPNCLVARQIPNIGYRSLTQAYTNSCPGGTFDFRSEPLPFTIQVNVSRLIQTFFFTKGGRPQLDIELRSGADWVGGALHGTDCDYSYRCAGNPDGFGSITMNYPSEVDVLPAGAQLTLHLTVYDQLSSYQFGFAGNHRSVLRIPYFTAEEALFRGLGALEPDGPAPVPSGAAWVLPPLAVFAAGRRHPKRAAALVVLMLTGLSGCLGNGKEAVVPPQEEAEGGDLDTTFFQDNGTINGDMESGSLYGLIRNDVDLPVADVNVILLENGNHTATNHLGYFSFKQLSPRTYTIYATKDGYKFFRAQVPVIAGRVTRPVITLQLVAQDVAKGHGHDYWNTATTIPWLKASYPMCEPNVNVQGRWSCPANAAETTLTPPPLRKDGQPSIVPPGTVDVEVRLKFDDAEAPRAMGLIVKDARDPNRTFLYPRASNVPFHYRTSWEATDSGHQLLTLWSISAFVWDEAYGAKNVPGHAYHMAPWGFEAEILLHRGRDLPTEPPHPNPWGANSTFDVYRGTMVFYGGPTGLGPAGVNLTPAGTRWLEVTTTWDRESIPAIKLNQLTYRSAQFPSNCVECWRAAPPPESTGPRSVVWRVPVNESDTDPHYAKSTNWAYAIGPDDENNGIMYSVANAYVCQPSIPQACQRMSFTTTVIAHKDLMPAAGP